MAYTKQKRFENFAYMTVMKTVLETELTPEEMSSPFLEDVCPDTKINLKNHIESLSKLMTS
jgi:hypothetical protein